MAPTTVNRLLQTLPSDLQDRLQSDLQLVQLAAGAILTNPDTDLEQVFFPTTCLISIVSSFESGQTIGATVVGSDGFAGMSALFGGAKADYTSMCQVSGEALRMSVGDFTGHLDDKRFRDA